MLFKNLFKSVVYESILTACISLQCFFATFNSTANVFSNEIEKQIIELAFKRVENFKYLVSTIANVASVDQDIMEKTRVSWLRLRDSSDVLLEERRRFYRTAVKPAMLYGWECWGMSQAQVKRFR